MELLFKLVNNVMDLKTGDILFKTMSDKPSLKKLVTYLNTKKQLEFGMLSDGDILPNYSERSQSEFGKANRPIMLKDTGEFWNSFEVILNSDGFEIDGDSVKFDYEPVDLIDVVDFWGYNGENVYGLTDKNMNIFLNALLPQIQKVIEKKILRRR